MGQVFFDDMFVIALGRLFRGDSQALAGPCRPAPTHQHLGSGSSQQQVSARGVAHALGTKKALASPRGVQGLPQDLSWTTPRKMTCELGET